MFKDVTGRSVLDEPHRETDRAAYAMAREWFAFEPRYALGLATLKADRLFDPEHPACSTGRSCGRACWSAGRRPGSPRAATASCRFADGFGLAIAGLALAGDRRGLSRAGAGACSRWFRSSSRYVATYAALLRRAALPAADRAAAPSRSSRSRSARSRPAARAGVARSRARACVRAAKVLGAGAGRRRRLAARLARAARRRPRPARAPPLGGDGGGGRRGPAAPALGVRRRRSRRSRRSSDRRRACASARATTGVRPRSACASAAARCRPGRYALHLRLESASGAARVALGATSVDVAAGVPATFDAVIDHPGGPLTMSGATDGATVWVGDATLKSAH